MKKFVLVFLSLLIILQCIVISGAVVYDGDSRYTIDIPENFQRVGENKFLSDDNSNLYVSFADNTQEQFCVADMSDKDIKEYSDKIVTESKALLLSFGIDADISVVSAEKVKDDNGTYFFIMVLETSYVKDGKTQTDYQKIYEFSGVENKISFTYTTDKKEQMNDMNGAFDSLVIKEEQVESKLDKIKTAGFYADVVVVILLVVIVFVKRRSK